MPYLLLALTTGMVVFQDIMKKTYNARAHGAPTSVFGFNIVFTIVCALFYLLLGGFDVTLSASSVPYMIAFGLTFAGSITFGILMINNGSLALTSLVLSYSLLIPALVGVVFLGEPFRLVTGVGIVLLVVSILLMNLKPRDKKEEGVRITKKWVFFAIACFLCNGLCSAVQKLFIRFTGGGERYGMSFYAMLIGLALFVILFLFAKQEHDWKLQLRGLPFMALNGTANSLSNALIMYLTETMNGVILYPVISVGSIIIAGIVGRLFFGEKLSRLQLIGYLIGAGAVLLLNL